jgi:hypothetical protein
MSCWSRCFNSVFTFKLKTQLLNRDRQLLELSRRTVQLAVAQVVSDSASTADGTGIQSNSSVNSREIVT